jgi:hypothetical protein
MEKGYMFSSLPSPRRSIRINYRAKRHKVSFDTSSSSKVSKVSTIGECPLSPAFGVFHILTTFLDQLNSPSYKLLWKMIIFTQKLILPPCRRWQLKDVMCHMRWPRWRWYFNLSKGMVVALARELLKRSENV